MPNFPAMRRNRTMSKMFFAGMVWAALFCAAVALADNPTTSDLIKAVQSGDQSARLRAIDTLGEQGETTPEAVAALVAQLKDKSPTIRARAAHALSHFGPPARSAVDALAPLVVDPDVQVQREAIRAWMRIHPGPNVSVPLLGKVLKDADPAVRTGGAATLGRSRQAGRARLDPVPQKREGRLLGVHRVGRNRSRRRRGCAGAERCARCRQSARNCAAKPPWPSARSARPRPRPCPS